MKNVIYILLISFVFTSCKSQTIIETKSKDVLIFEFKNDNIKLARYYTKVYHQDGTYEAIVEASANKEIFNKQNISIITQEWQAIGSNYINKRYSFIQQKDTMTIKCICGQERNYYFKNLEFKKGNYELNFNSPKMKIQYQEIDSLNRVKNIFFKNTYVPEEELSIRDLYLYDIRFYYIDLHDTINVRLRKVDDFLF